MEKTNLHKKFKKTKLYKETNKKFVERVMYMIYGICGCDDKRALEVIKEVKKKINQKQKQNK